MTIHSLIKLGWTLCLRHATRIILKNNIILDFIFKNVKLGYLNNFLFGLI
jgi:hypothetical protein